MKRGLEVIHNMDEVLSVCFGKVGLWGVWLIGGDVFCHISIGVIVGITVC